MTVIRWLLPTVALFVVLASPATTASAATVNCSAFASQAAAQAAYRADPLGLANLDRDRDGIACEDNPAPFDRTPVNLASVSTASAARTVPTAATGATQARPAPPVTGDGSSQSTRPVNWTTLGLLTGLLLGLGASCLSIRRSWLGIRLRNRD